MDKISDIKKEFELAKDEKLADMINNHQSDERTGVVKLVTRYKKKLEMLIKESKRIEMMWEYEKKYAGIDYIAGIDEVGRGPLAGPVVTCAVILPKDCDLPYVNDSKQLSEKRREELYEEILRIAVAVGIGSCSHMRIDEINILNATYEAMRQSVEKLSVRPGLLLNDAVTIPNIQIKQIPIIKGDAKSISIAAASIVAKVTRDRLMTEYDKIFPGYGFASNKGYGSKDHTTALLELGPSPLHRMSFIKNFIK